MSSSKDATQMTDSRRFKLIPTENLTPEQRALAEALAQRHGRTFDAPRFERRLAFLLSRPGAAARQDVARRRDLPPGYAIDLAGQGRVFLGVAHVLDLETAAGRRALRESGRRLGQREDERGETPSHDAILP